ncbi:hypothetical protein ACFL2V_07420 [Pseudomonadota bacterium]
MPDTMAPPPIKPDWSKTTEYRLMLSGQQVQFVVPGNMADDYPSTLEISPNINIYDTNLYGDWKRYEIADVWWYYKKRVLLIMPERLGTLALKIAIYAPDDGGDLFEESQLETAIIKLFKEAYPDKEDQNRVPYNFDYLNINGANWSQYVKKGRNPVDDRFCYSVPITSTHFLEVSFKVFGSYEHSEHNWYKAAQADIEKLINSFNVTYTPSQK